MQIGSWERGWVVRIGLLNPQVWKYQNFGRMKTLVIFGVLRIICFHKRKGDETIPPR